LTSKILALRQFVVASNYEVIPFSMSFALVLWPHRKIGQSRALHLSKKGSFSVLQLFNTELHIRGCWKLIISPLETTGTFD
jgi:hypothetical protein